MGNDHLLDLSRVRGLRVPTRYRNQSNAKVPQQLNLAGFHQIDGDIDADFGASSGTEFFEERMHDFTAGGQKALFDLRVLHERVKPAGQSAHAAFAFFQLDIVSLAVGHGDRRGTSTASRETARMIGNLLYQTAMGFRVSVFLK